MEMFRKVGAQRTVLSFRSDLFIPRVSEDITYLTFAKHIVRSTTLSVTAEGETPKGSSVQLDISHVNYL